MATINTNVVMSEPGAPAASSLALTAASGTLSGAVQSPPLVAQVVALHAASLVKVASTFSDASTGAFELAVPDVPMLVLVRDLAGSENAVVLDRVDPA